MPPTVQVSCLVNASIEATTNHLLTTGSGSKVVLWSESSLAVNNDSALIEAGKVVSRRFGVYLGMAYNLRIPQMGTYEYQNMFTLIEPPGINGSTTATVAIRYQKAHPLALIESISQPSPGKPDFPFVNTPFGKMGVLLYVCLVFSFIVCILISEIIVNRTPCTTRWSVRTRMGWC